MRPGCGGRVGAIDMRPCRLLGRCNRGASLRDFVVEPGKFFELQFEGLAADKAREAADDIARRVLANPVIESYRVEIDG